VRFLLQFLIGYRWPIRITAACYSVTYILRTILSGGNMWPMSKALTYSQTVGSGGVDPPYALYTSTL